MKRFLAFFLSAVILLTCPAMAADASGKYTSKEAYNTYAAAQEAMAGIKSTEGKISGVVKVTGSDIPEGLGDITMSGTYKQIVRSATDIQMAMDMDMTMGDLDVGLNTKSYFKDGYMYSRVGDEKIKQKTDIEGMLEEAGVINLDFLGQDGMGFFTEATMVDQNDGIKRIDFTIDKKTMQTLLGGASADSLFSGMSFGNIKATVWIGKTGLPIQQSMSFGMSMKEDGKTYKFSYKITTKVTGFNTVNKITFPSDLASYKEI